MISEAITRGVLSLKTAVTKIVVMLRISPNALTLASLVPTALATYYLANGRLTLAGLWIIGAGFFDVIERGERMVLLLLALFFNKLGAGMWMLAGLAWLTTIQRLIHTHRALQAGQHRAPAEPA